MKVHILATCNNDALLPYTTLVFKTLRVGFPTAKIIVHKNGLESLTARTEVAQAAFQADCEVLECKRRKHHEWIESLLETETEPFWICDTDIIFYESVEKEWLFSDPIAGYRIPEFHDEFTQAITRSRLHTSLLYIDPAKLKKAVENFNSVGPKTEFNPRINLVHPIVLPLNGRHYFYDTCSLLYHAVGGTAFPEELKEKYFHFHFGTLSDIVLPRLKERTDEVRDLILNRPDLGRGMWRHQDEYFASRQAIADGVDVIDKIKPEDAEEAAKWNVALCKGNKEAMIFCDYWYNYVHGIDDLIDTMEDGRPRMSKDQMIGLFFKAALLYNCSFFVANRDILFPIVLQITNTYADSVAWECSPKEHLRKMADVFRTCGDEMYVMVALLCGGEDHMRQMSRAIKERDWLGQHDEHGKPT